MRTLLTLLLLISLNSFSQSIPSFQFESLTKETVRIPENTNGKFTLICLATSTKAQQELEGWLDPLYQKFIAKSGLMDDAFDVNLYFIPVISGTQAFADKVKTKFSENTQTDIRPHVLFFNGDNNALLSSYSIPKDNSPHFLLLNEEGKVVFRTSGSYSEEKLDKVDDLISGM